MTNETKPTTTILNSAKVDIGETWNTIVSIWDDEIRTWDIVSQLITNSTKNNSSITNQLKP